jgi:aminoglycoside 3-N-acetyltransferase I
MNDHFQIKHLGKEDLLLFQELIGLFREVFEMENAGVPGDPYLAGLLEDPHFIAYAAIGEKKVIGGLTAYELPMVYAGRSEMFIYDLAVQPAFQRTGIGQGLMAALQQYCRQNGIREMFVAANEEDSHAIDFYRRIGGQEERVRHFTYLV